MINLGSATVNPTTGVVTGSGFIFDLYTQIALANAAFVPNPSNPPTSTLTATYSVGGNVLTVDQTLGWSVGAGIQIGPLYSSITALTSTSITIADTFVTNGNIGDIIGYTGTSAAWMAVAMKSLIKIHQAWVREATGHATGIFGDYKQAQGVPRYSLVNRTAMKDVVTVNTTTSPGLTTGIYFLASSSTPACDGVRFFWPGGTSSTVRASIWDLSVGRLGYVDVAVGYYGIYEAVFSTPVVLSTSHSLAATIWENTGTKYLTAADTYLNGKAPILVEPGLQVVSIELQSAGDTLPLSTGSNQFAFVEPLFLQA